MSAPQDHPFVAVVTGANKGIGHEIALKLCQMAWDSNEKHEGAVYVCSRDIERGRDAVSKLQTKFKTIPRLLQLDVEDEASVARASGIIKQEQPHIDVLVLNAGMAFKHNATEGPEIQFPRTFSVNYYGVRRCMDAMLPLMSTYGRVVILASVAGYMAWEKTSAGTREKLMKTQDMAQLDQFASELIETAKRGSFEKEGVAPTAYGNSKLLVTRLTQLEAERMSHVKPHLLINCCCPGWCKSDMAGWDTPPKTCAQGAETPYMLCMLPCQSTINGKFYSEGKDASYLKP